MTKRKPPVPTPEPNRSPFRFWPHVAAVAVVAAAAGAWWWGSHPREFITPLGTSTSPVAAAQYVGSQACASCHADAFAVWNRSHHAHAMQEASGSTVLGNFNDKIFRYAGVDTTFSQRDGKYWVRTDGAGGKLTDFPVSYTFGVAPLQQYLVGLPGGRFQALSIAWDSRPSAQGGQRWFHLYPHDKVDYRDELHWTRHSQNWNFMCADCHSTDVHKNYDPATDSYHTTWHEISVGCEGCHGPGSAHLQWAKTKPADPTKGLTVALTERASVRWTVEASSGNATRSSPRAHDTEIGVCAQCHARRGQIAEGYHPGLPFQDFYRPALLGAGLYYPDGQQLDEDYVWGSFLQSRMYHAGVTCSDCHNPHTEKLRAQGNALCTQCHLASKYDDVAHHHHPRESAGAQCVECHMPARTYMGVNPRRDHSLRVPRPDQTTTLGTPNSCNGCHQNRDAKWAAAQLQQWYGHQPQGFQHYAEAFYSAERGAAEAGPLLVSVAVDPSQPPIARASALEALAGYPAAATFAAARAGITDNDSLIRRASIGTLAMLPPAHRLPLVAPLLQDPIRTVRMEATSVLAGAMGGADALQRAAFERGAAEYESSLQFTSDRPESRTALGDFYLREGRVDDARAAFQSALALDPGFVPAYVNLADLLRMQGKNREGEQALREGIRQIPTAAALPHALGLTLIRLGRKPEALVELKQAVRLAPADVRFAYVYAVALNSSGQAAAAIQQIDRALTLRPDDHDLLVAAVTFRSDSGDRAGARTYAQRLLKRYPEDPDALQLSRALDAPH